jgi:hypothetical protein
LDDGVNVMARIKLTEIATGSEFYYDNVISHDLIADPMTMTIEVIVGKEPDNGDEIVQVEREFLQAEFTAEVVA